MADTYVQLRRTTQPNPNQQPGQLPYLLLTLFWDQAHRTYYPTQSQVADPIAPEELIIGTEVQRVVNLAGKVTSFYYAGDGRVEIKHLAPGGTGGGPPTGSLGAPVLTPGRPNTSSPGAGDGVVDVLPTLGSPPYQVRLSIGPAYDVTKVAPNSIYPVRFPSLTEGLYTLTITDAQQRQRTQRVQVSEGSGRPYGAVLQESYRGDDQTGTGTLTIWNPNSLAVEGVQFTGGGTDGYQFQLPQGEYVDGYYLPDGITWRKVYGDGSQGVYFVDSSAAATGARLQLHNLILFHPDSVAEQNGGIIVEVDSPALPVTFTLGSVSNQTGRFDGLAADTYLVHCQDAAGNALDVTCKLTLDYAVRWRLHFQELSGALVDVELWKQGYTGSQVETIFGQAVPVVLKWEGLSGSLGGFGDLPPVVGSSCQLALRTRPRALEEVLLGTDRACRVDVRRNGQLAWRGYVQPDIYHQRMLDGYQELNLTATDGLAGLKDTDFLGHVGQRLASRRPVLHTLLHCLSRTSISLPLLLAVNRRATDMDSADAPEEVLTTERSTYWDDSKQEPQDQRSVTDALAQVLGGTLCQREGQWQVRSALEALDDAPARTYRPAGTALGPVTVTAPAATITPFRTPSALGWLRAEQQRQVRPGWKALVGKTNAGWRKNAFIAGDVFSDQYAFVADGSRLKPLNGWVAEAGKLFPLVQVKGGQKGEAYATQWLRSSVGFVADTAYLESPPLPLVAPPEDVPFAVTVKGKLVPAAYLTVGLKPAVAGTAQTCTLPYLAVVDGQPAAQLSLATFKLSSEADADQEVTLQVPALPAGATTLTLRLYSWYAPNANLLATAQPVPDPSSGAQVTEYTVFRHQFTGGPVRLFEAQYGGVPVLPTGEPDDPFYIELPATDFSTGRLLLSSVAVKLLPQNAEWDGEDNFRADGPAGTVRPTEELAVTHVDVPIAAGLFEGNRFSFSKAVALQDGSLTTAWLRALDKQASPLFESNVYDIMALRAGPSVLLTGPLRYRGTVQPPWLLDSLDAPSDEPGRRFLVASVDEWNLKHSVVQVSLGEVGPGADAPDPVLELPVGVRVIHKVYQYAPGKYSAIVRGTHDGKVRVRHV